jgi:hypothetical protein
VVRALHVTGRYKRGLPDLDGSRGSVSPAFHSLLRLRLRLLSARWGSTARASRSIRDPRLPGTGFKWSEESDPRRGPWRVVRR